MLALPLSPVPSINIQLCAEQSPVKEPSSPFDNIEFSMDHHHHGLESYRSQHLLPPPIHSPKERQGVAAARPTTTTTAAAVTAGGRGLDAARFEALRNASRSIQHVVRQDLRKEVALRAHQSKQIERRNLFLSKIEALPSPTAASLPVTPPESPAIFHFSLPSPGLISPLALFETLDNDGVGREQRPVRVEQVDFRARARKEAEALAAVTGNMKQSLQVHGLAAPDNARAQPKQPSQQKPQPKRVSGRTNRSQLPSLDQISARLGGNVTITRSTSPVSRLPAFLQRTSSPPAGGNTQLSNQDPVVATPARSITPPASIGTSTTTITPAAFVAAPTPKYTFVPTNSHGPIARPSSSGAVVSKHPSIRLPLCPTSVSLPGPRIASTRAPTPLTAEALNALADRAERGCAMMERLQKRFSAPARLAAGSAQQPNVRSLARPIGGF